MTKEEKSLHTLVDSVQYDVNLFKVYIGENKYIMGYVSATPEDNNFFVYKTIYDTIIDLDESFNRFLIISLDVLICRYSPLLRAFPALFISEEPHKSFYYPSCFRSQK